MACSSNGPTKEESQEVISGVYFQESNIIKIRPCEITTKIKEDGKTNVWMIKYEFKESGKKGVMLISEEDSEAYPWMPYRTLVGAMKTTYVKYVPLKY